MEETPSKGRSRAIRSGIAFHSLAAGCRPVLRLLGLENIGAFSFK
jgi:hypothetical protein